MTHLTSHPQHDKTLYAGTAGHYRARPPYARGLVELLAALGLTGGRLLDVGCGPGVLALLLAQRYDECIGLDPDAEMLREAAREATRRDVHNVRWVRGRAEDIPALVQGPFKLVTFGQSFHWTDRDRVAEIAFDLLEPAGGLAIVSHEHDGRPVPPAPPFPIIPHEAIHALIRRYLGDGRRAGTGYLSLPAEPHEELLRRSRFGAAEVIFLPGRADLVVGVDQVVSNFLSMSFAAPGLFGEALPLFEADLRAELEQHSPGGLFWDWPGDTKVILARKSG